MSLRDGRTSPVCLREQGSAIFYFIHDFLRNDNKQIAYQYDGRTAAEQNIDSEYEQSCNIHKNLLCKYEFS